MRHGGNTGPNPASLQHVKNVSVRAKWKKWVVTGMDTPKQGWTPYDAYTTEIVLET